MPHKMTLKKPMKSILILVNVQP
uniref:Uncharacterized protein n=1 Tax=Acrobeloides nanus TaxID=290746 RepID=A0A914DLT2_9BILA